MMTINHAVMSNARLATFQRIESVLRLKNKTLPNFIVFKSNGIPIHGRLVLQFFTMDIDGV
jgi:hypothetical protein